MLKCFSLFCLVLTLASVVRDVHCEPELCEKCVPVDKCTMYGDMNKREQEQWNKDHPCKTPESEDVGVLFGFAPVAKGDYVCCPYSNIWGVEDPGKRGSDDANVNGDSKPTSNDGKPDAVDSGVGSRNGYDQDNLHEGQNSRIHKDGIDEEVSIEGSRYRNPSRWQPGRPNDLRYNNYYPDSRGPPRNQNFMNRPNGRMTQGGFNPYLNTPVYNPGNNFNRPNPSFNGPNERASNLPSPRQNYGGQCPMSSLPPAGQTGCCGLEANGDLAAGGGNNYMSRPVNSNYWNPPAENSRRFTRDTPESFGITLDNRIAGGKRTNLYQFPWTVLLKTTFNYGDRQSTFNCGGSLISSRYVLTAGHCVFEEEARVQKIDVYLAEYDKRTYPTDCINSPEGRQCIDNILVQAEDFIIHPNYDNIRLQDDIALIRLRENVPYTEFTRPICLPPINIDNPDYSNLRLAVAGWGRNGSVPSQVKQSTVVNLVPQRQCSRAYPLLTNKHLCAAGHSGEDTCKGDSGGPLMMLYEGKYYVSGVVSGKRADAPCGTAVPSLYTNVYHYLNWIINTIRQ